MTSWNGALKNHIMLSETHAEDYDSEYGSLITRQYMVFEQHRLNQTAGYLVDMQNNRVALDIGCGTGRCALDLSKYFQQVIGLDFSPKMIEVASKNANRENIKNVAFLLRDVSTDGLGIYDVPVDMLNFAFGMGSFFENPRFLVSEIDRVLSRDGVLHITFYNRDSHVCNLSSYVDVGLTALPLIESDQLSVDGTLIPCKFYTVAEVDALFEGFEKISLLTYPTLLPLVKEKALSSPETLRWCLKQEEMMGADYKGYYISAIYRRK